MTYDRPHNTSTTRTRMVWLGLLSLIMTLLLLSACGASLSQLPQGVQVKATEISSATSSADTDTDTTEADDTTVTSEAEEATDTENTEDTATETSDDSQPADEDTAETEAEANEADTAEAEANESDTAEAEANTAESDTDETEANESDTEADTDEADTDEIDTDEDEADEIETPADQSASDEDMTMAEIINTTRHFKGDDDAAVTIIEFSDFQCPYCSRFAKETIPQIAEDYIDKGIVRIGYRHAAYHRGDAFLAAEASECAADQDAFWDYHDLLIDRLVVDGKQDFPQEVLKQFATDLDLDSKMFNTCLESGTYSDLVREETNESQQIFQVSGTPTFLINGNRLVGAYPYPAFAEAIETARDVETDSSEQAVQMEEEQPDPEEQAQELMNILFEETRHFKGDPDAPITIFEFSDFQCPFCSRFATETAPQIDEMYIQEGLVRMGYIHAAYHEGDAYTSAEASECAADQDAFWDYHDLLIERLADEGKHDFPKDVLKQYAADLDLDTEQFNTCLDEGTYADVVREQTQLSQYIGVTGTPTFVVNGKGLVGAQPFEVFQQVLDEELAAAE